MKKYKFLKVCFVLMLILICIIPNLALATNFNTSEYKSNAASDYGITSKVNKVLGAALYIVRIVGVGVAIIILTVIACKYMFASAGDRADIKKHAVPYVIGAVVMMAASGIFGILESVSKTI